MTIAYPILGITELVRDCGGAQVRRWPEGVREGRLTYELLAGQRIWRIGYLDAERGRLTERWQYVTVQHIDENGVTVAVEPMMHPKHLPWVVRRRYLRTVPGKSEGYDYTREIQRRWTGTEIWDEGERVLCIAPLPELSGLSSIYNIISAGELPPEECYEDKGRRYSGTIYNANLRYFRAAELSARRGA